MTDRSPADMARRVRVSMSVLLRIKDDNEHVLFHSLSRPGSYGPPGGVIKYFPPAAAILEAIGFQEERPEARREALTRWDLRGFVPATAVRDFLRWFGTGAYREDPEECLFRELLEEFQEVGLAELAHSVRALSYAPVRSVTEGPDQVPGKLYTQLRRFEIYDIVATDSTALRLTRELVQAAMSPDYPLVLAASRADIEHGRQGTALIGPQTSLLLGPQRIRPDLPPLA
jgi:hypothetical protein